MFRGVGHNGQKNQTDPGLADVTSASNSVDTVDEPLRSDTDQGSRHGQETDGHADVERGRLFRLLVIFIQSLVRRKREEEEATVDDEQDDAHTARDFEQVVPLHWVVDRTAEGGVEASRDENRDDSHGQEARVELRGRLFEFLLFEAQATNKEACSQDQQQVAQY